MNYRLSAALSVTLLTCSSVGAVRAQSDFETKVAPVLKTYCVSCHGGTRPKAELGLDRLAADFDKHGETWKGVMDRIGDGSMPPKGRRGPRLRRLGSLLPGLPGSLPHTRRRRRPASAGPGCGGSIGSSMPTRCATCSAWTSTSKHCPRTASPAVLTTSTTPSICRRPCWNATSRPPTPPSRRRCTRGRSRGPPAGTSIYAPIGQADHQGDEADAALSASARAIRDSEVLFFGANDVAKPLIETRAGRAGLYRYSHLGQYPAARQADAAAVLRRQLWQGRAGTHDPAAQRA